MKKERYVAAIEISSAKIIAVVGKTRGAGQLDIIASEQEKNSESVRYGIIKNPEETSMRIARIIERLERKPSVAPREITGLFVGLSGRSLRSISTEVSINLPDDTEITEEIIERLKNQALSTAIDSSLEVVDAVPRVYVVGKMETASPKGTIGNSISATFDLIVCRPEIRKNLERTISDKIGVDVSGYVVTALSTAQVILTPEEKRLGCMLVDMGAETTTVSIYKEGHLVYFATLPLGGRHITNDVATLNFLEDKAEEIKISVGNAIARETASTLNMNGVKMQDVSNLIVARAEEIVVNVMEQITYAGLKESSLPRGLVMIGGGSKLNGMIELLEQHTGLPVRRGQLPSYISIEETKSPLSEMVEVASVLYAGAMNTETECLETPGNEDLPATGTGNEPTGTTPEKTEHRQKPKGPSLFGKLKEKLYGMVTGDVEDNSDII